MIDKGMKKFEKAHKRMLRDNKTAKMQITTIYEQLIQKLPTIANHSEIYSRKKKRKNMSRQRSRSANSGSSGSQLKIEGDHVGSPMSSLKQIKIRREEQKQYTQP